MEINSLMKLIKMLLLLCCFSAPVAFANAQAATQATEQENKQEPKRTEEVSLNQLQAHAIIKGWNYFLKNIASKEPINQVAPQHYSMRLYKDPNYSDAIDYIIFIDQDGIKTEGIYETRNLPQKPETTVSGDQLKALLVAWSNFTKLKELSDNDADYSFCIYREEDFIYVDIAPKMPTLIWSTTDPKSKIRRVHGAFVYQHPDLVYKLRYKDYSVVELIRTE